MQTLCARVQHAYSASRVRPVECQRGLIMGAGGTACVSNCDTKVFSTDGGGDNKEIKEITQERDYETMTAGFRILADGEREASRTMKRAISPSH